MRSVVVLPAPFGPRKPVTVPASSANESPSTARRSPKRFVRASAARTTVMTSPCSPSTPFASGILLRLTPMSPEVQLSSADRVLFPDDGVTKGDLFRYYGEVAPAILPHLRDRPFTMKR